MKIKIFTGGVAAIIGIGLVGIAHANLLTNGSFEDNSVQTASFWTLGVGNTSLPGWSITGGSIDWIDGLWQPSNGDKSLDMNGSSPGTIVSDDFTTIVGQQYDVSFDMAGNTDGAEINRHLTLTAAGVSENFFFDTTGHSFSNMGWTTMNWSFIATNTLTQLQFSGWSLDGYSTGAALDNVVVVASSPSPFPVPEPATMLLFATGLAGIAGLRRRGHGQ